MSERIETPLPGRLSPLEDMRVIAEDGSHLGHVFEIRSPGKAETEPTYAERRVDCLLCGRPGWLERLGWKQHQPRKIPWNAVLGIDERGIRVRGGGDDYDKAGAR